MNLLELDEISMQLRETHCRMHQLMAQMQELQYKVNSLTDAKEFHDPETASSSGISHNPSQPVSIPSSRGMISRDSCLQLDTQNSIRYLRKRF